MYMYTVHFPFMSVEVKWDKQPETG